MATPQAHYMKLTPSQLTERMQRRVSIFGMHPQAMLLELDKLLTAKKEVKSARAREMQLNRLWKELLMPLVAERKNVRAMLRYKEEDEPERQEALKGYMLVLETLKGKLELESRKGFTPAQVAKAQNRPNNGNHWTDWVPPSVKVKVQELFDAIPREGIRKKTPFERRIPAPLGKQMKERLLKRTEKELEVAKAGQRAAYMSGEQDAMQDADTKVDYIEQALEWIAKAEYTEALPTTWHGFF